MSKLNSAIIMATTAHGDQKDRAGEPYILHPLRVMLKMKTEEERIVAVLHDTLEDTKLTEEEILNEFGLDILEAVRSVTRFERPVKEIYSDYIKRAKLHPIGRKVKIADLEDNMSPERLGKLPLKEDAEGGVEADVLYSS